MVADSRISPVAGLDSSLMQVRRRTLAQGWIQRLTSRGLEHVGEPTWEDVQRRRSDYAAWTDAVVQVDTGGRTADEIADLLTTRFGSR